MEVKLFLSKARTKTERILFQSKLGNKRQADQSSLQRGICFRHQEKMTMSTKITMALVAVVIACASPALAGGNGSRDNGYTSRSAQYCIPQFDDNLRVYC